MTKAVFVPNPNGTSNSGELEWMPADLSNPVEHVNSVWIGKVKFVNLWLLVGVDIWAILGPNHVTLSILHPSWAVGEGVV